MKLKKGVTLVGLHPVMREALGVVEEVWKSYGRTKGVTVTSTMDGIHSAASWHYYGCAFDIRTRYWDRPTQEKVHAKLKAKLPEYDVVLENTHIHVEPSDSLAKKWRLML